MLGKKGWEDGNEWPNLNLIPTACMTVFLQAKVPYFWVMSYE